MTTHALTHTETGGGCTALTAEHDGYHVLITGQETCNAPDETDTRVMVGLYCDDPDGVLGGTAQLALVDHVPLYALDRVVSDLLDYHRAPHDDERRAWSRAALSEDDAQRVVEDAEDVLADSADHERLDHDAALRVLQAAIDTLRSVAGLDYDDCAECRTPGEPALHHGRPDGDMRCPACRRRWVPMR